jgi:hypothetical protein
VQGLEKPVQVAGLSNPISPLLSTVPATGLVIADLARAVKLATVNRGTTAGFEYARATDTGTKTNVTTITSNPAINFIVLFNIVILN